MTQDERLARLRLPVLALVTDSQRRPPALEATGRAWLDDVVRDAVLGGVTIVQLREKRLSPGDRIALGLHVRDAMARRALFFVNSDIDAAIALGADGVHLPAGEGRVADVRRRAGDRMLVSRAAHSVDEALVAQDQGADIVQLGTIFATASKPGVAPIGVAAVREACERVSIPVLAIGGVTAANAAAAIDAGAAGVAVIGAIMDAEHPRAAAAQLRETIDRAWRA